MVDFASSVMRNRVRSEKGKTLRRKRLRNSLGQGKKDYPMRRVIQLESFVSKEHQQIFALCDDGTIWAYGHAGEWSALPPIPQDKEERPPPTRAPSGG